MFELWTKLFNIIGASILPLTMLVAVGWIFILMILESIEEYKRYSAKKIVDFFGRRDKVGLDRQLRWETL